MADEKGTGAHSLIRQLEEKPYTFNFFQAVRRLQCAHPELPRLGTSAHPRDDFVRFCQQPSLRFASSSISTFTPGNEEKANRMFVEFLGLLGPNGPLPAHLTEYAQERILHHQDETLARFLDIFNHRMVSLFYQAWASAQKTVNYDKPATDRYSFYFSGLLGIGMDSLRRRDSIPDRAKLYFSGHLMCPNGHSEGLQSILQEYFGLPAQVEQFVSQWINLPPASCCRLGESPETGSLGSTTIIGSRVWDCQNKFRIKIGPMDFAKYRRLLPGGKGYRRLVDWVRNYVGDIFSWEVQLVLQKSEVPQIQLGRLGKIGQSTWLQSSPFKNDVDDCILNPEVA
ncbi:MAG: type VI secretion system baseplate subunit TssG [Sedimentisphaerales bacterium]|nr:type VI secretion system baseplate subunit TssG [Sedimentisphaerales bacterium]